MQQEPASVRYVNPTIHHDWASILPLSRDTPRDRRGVCLPNVGEENAGFQKRARAPRAAQANTYRTGQIRGLPHRLSVGKARIEVG